MVTISPLNSSFTTIEHQGDHSSGFVRHPDDCCFSMPRGMGETLSQTAAMATFVCDLDVHFSNHRQLSRHDGMKLK
jgi:hypothetical protein